MALYKKDTVVGITERQIRANYPNTSFPQVMQPQHVAEFGYEVYESPAPEPYVPTTEETLTAYGTHLDAYLDSVAASLTFTNGRYALALRAGYPNPWQPLATAFSTWMDTEVNAVAWQIQKEILAGTRPLPTWEEFLAMLPTFKS